MTDDQRHARHGWWRRLARHPLLLLMLALAVPAVIALTAFVHYYSYYARFTDSKLKTGPFADTANIYAAPEVIAAGQKISPDGLAAALRESGYGERPGRQAGWFHATAQGVEIVPGPRASFLRRRVIVGFDRGKVSRIVLPDGGPPLTRIELEPRLMANLSDRSREKRLLVRFEDVPKVLLYAVISVEDKRFFEHDGVDTLRLLKAAWVDLKDGRKEQGASTITMQLARSLWLDPGKRWTRKAIEMLITFHLEQKLPKQKIFEYYANEVYLGQRGTFSIHGFGEAARAYFSTDIRRLTLPEAATLAGMVQRPGFYDPFRNPASVMKRRNLVLELMRKNGYITPRQYEAAASSPLSLAPEALKPTEAPYFVDLVRDQLRSRFEGRDFDGIRHDVYTTIDLDLQRAAVEAVHGTMRQIDARLKKRGETRTAQVALVALDPRTGDIRALVGGRNYLASQLNRALALRQPGSAFKPFVYAAALDTALVPSGAILTPASLIDDEPTTFLFNNQVYEPGNFQKIFHGEVTLRQALEDSINVATVKIAQTVGYGRIAMLAKEAGLSGEGATPSLALGAYDVTPLAMAGAYTVFANQGVYVRPGLIASVRDRNGVLRYVRAPETRRVLDPRVAYLTGHLMEGVLDHGTGASARADGFTAPAAGKTGTSRDGWFAGFTSRLLCVVWVGFDDGHDLDIEGARSALPVWTAFMKSALALPRYAHPEPFQAPEGIVTVRIDPLSGQLATLACPSSQDEQFIEGTEPAEQCYLHVGLPASLPSLANSPATSSVQPAAAP